jgi:hypothetical protein
VIIYAAGNSPNLPEYWFYGNTVCLKFDQSCWVYYRVMPDGSLEPQSGVTGVLKIIDKSEALMRWAVRVALARTKKLLVEGGYVGEDAKRLYESVLDDILDRARKADKEELESAGECGHAAHAWIESLIKSILSGDEDRRLELFAKLPEDERAANGCIAAVEWMWKHNVRWISTERKIFSLLYGYAGTADGLAVCDSCGDRSCCPVDFHDHLSLIDWKTSNYLYNTYLAQAACYQQAIEEETGDKIIDRWVIRLGKDDAEFDPWRFGPETFDYFFQFFLRALDLYKIVHKVDDIVSEFKADRTKVKRALAKEIRDAEYAVKCLDADEYKGVRKKKCNGTDYPCEACAKKYLDNHPSP